MTYKDQQFQKLHIDDDIECKDENVLFALRVAKACHFAGTVGKQDWHKARYAVEVLLLKPKQQNSRKFGSSRFSIPIANCLLAKNFWQLDWPAIGKIQWSSCLREIFFIVKSTWVLGLALMHFCLASLIFCWTMMICALCCAVSSLHIIIIIIRG